MKSSARFFLLMGLLAVVAQAEEAPPEILEAAKRGIATTLLVLPTGNLADHGFSDVEEVRAAGLGDPFRIHTLELQKILEFDGSTRVESLLTSSGSWFVPVTNQGRSVTLLEVVPLWVDRQGRTGWSCSGLGDPVLARALDELRGLWPASSGMKVILLCVPSINGSFALLDNGLTERMSPLAPLHDPFMPPHPDRPLLGTSVSWGSFALRPNVPEESPFYFALPGPRQSKGGFALYPPAQVFERLKPVATYMLSPEFSNLFLHPMATPTPMATPMATQDPSCGGP